MRALVYLTIFVMSGIWLCSCRTQYVPVETIKEKIEYRDRFKRDSIHIKDSIFIRTNGDTVFVDRWRMEYKDKLVRDTTYIHETDSIQVPFPVEKKLSKWESFKVEVGGWAFGVILFGLIALILSRYRSRKK